ncbi:unnamed protein product, partial [Linum tenue]
ANEDPAQNPLFPSIANEDPAQNPLFPSIANEDLPPPPQLFPELDELKKNQFSCLL